MSGKEDIREYDKIKYSDKDMWWANSKIAVAVFFLSLIYGRFLADENSTILMKDDIEDNTELIKSVELSLKEDMLELKSSLNGDINTVKSETNRRLDTKTERNKNDIDKNVKDIEQLKLPNSDKEKKN